MKAIKLTKSAYRNLGQDDIKEMEACLPSLCEESEVKNSMGEELVWVVNLNDLVHPSFLEFE